MKKTDKNRYQKRIDTSFSNKIFKLGKKIKLNPASFRSAGVTANVATHRQKEKQNLVQFQYLEKSFIRYILKKF